MLETMFIGGGIMFAVAILFVCLFVRFGRGWNGDLGGGAKRRR